MDTIHPFTMGRGASKSKIKGASSEKSSGRSFTGSVVELPSILDQVQRDMGDSWRTDEGFLDKFFPIDPAFNSSYEKVRVELYNDNRRVKRWKGIPKKPKQLSRLYTPLTMLMNRILFHYGISRDHRLFLDTHIRRRTASSLSALEPGIFLAGVGEEFANTMEDLPRFVLVSGVSAFEVSLDSEDLTEARIRLAVHMHEIFQYQDNRRFAYGVVITPNTFTVYMFDHSGAVASHPCDYHAHPDRFCAVIFGLAAEKDRIGFDNTIFNDGILAKVRTYEPRDEGPDVQVHYTLRQALFQFASLIGRGTICWLTTGADNKTLFVIKDAWIAPSELAGKESEGSLLRHVKAQGILLGVAQIHHFEEVRRSTDASDLDTIFRNRKICNISPADFKEERVHTRLVLTTHGKTIDQFSDKRELLQGFYDAVRAHRKLYEEAGILHRDISLRNILINPDGVEGDRGILIDLDHSIRVDDTSPYSTKTKMGTWRYMSRVVLLELAPHSYLDDLESFYYVLCWILGSFESPGVHKAELPYNLESWDTSESGSLKHGQMVHRLKMPISPWFGKPLAELVVRFHDFFSHHSSRRKPPSSSPPIDPGSDARFLSLIRSPLDSNEDYDDFIALIQQAMSDLDAEEGDLEADAESASRNPHLTKSEAPGSQKRKRDSQDGGEDGRSHSPQPIWPIMHEEPPLGRPRRTNVDYGLPKPVTKRR